MAKFAGRVGYVSQIEEVPGVWTADITPRMMKGDLIRQQSSSQNGDKVNDDISFNHNVSLLGDAYAFGNYYNIKWIEIDGMKWRVNSVEIKRPRILLGLGGLYNG